MRCCAIRASAASTWLMTADNEYVQPGNPSIRRLPATQEELNDYDCIVLYDPDPALWPSEYNQMLTDFVAKAGGGLIYVAGERHDQATVRSPGRSKPRLAEHAADRQRAGPLSHGSQRQAQQPRALAAGDHPRRPGGFDFPVCRQAGRQRTRPDQPPGHVLALSRHPCQARRDRAGAAWRPADAQRARAACPAGDATCRPGPHDFRRLRQHLPLALPR